MPGIARTRSSVVFANGSDVPHTLMLSPAFAAHPCKGLFVAQRPAGFSRSGKTDLRGGKKDNPARRGRIIRKSPSAQAGGQARHRQATVTAEHAMNELEHYLAFLHRAGQLKDTLRNAYTATGRTESVAEHSWRLALLAMLVQRRYPALDMAAVLKLCLIHDLGEALHGDIPAPRQDPAAPKSDAERRDLLVILEGLPEAERAEILALWDDYDRAATPEARLVKALDKLETLLQHTEGRNPPGFDYEFNLDYGRTYTDLDDCTRDLRALIDARTRRRMQNPQ